ncbi:MraY family glycosyltransferase [Thermococcus sp.]
MVLISPFIGLLLSLVLTPYTAGLMRKAGIIGKDIHKPDLPEVPEMGGLAILISLPLALIPVLGAQTSEALIIFLLFGLVGILDDLTNMRQSHKVLLSLLVSTPLLAFASRGQLNLIFLSLSLGALYGVFAVLFVTGSANLVNMLAGFNGLEVGTSAIALFFLGLMTAGDARILAFTGCAVALGFLWWNRYPARVFPGDTGTLSLGALIGIVGIMGKVELFTAILLLPHAIDFLLKTRIRFAGRSIGRTQVLEDGTLKAPPYPSFLGMIMRAKRVREYELVAMVWGIEAILGIISLLLSA